MVQRVAKEVGLESRLHLWPDGGLQSENAFHEIRKAEWNRQHPDLKLSTEQRAELKRLNEAAYAEHLAWLEGWWSRISEWPGVERAVWTLPALPAPPPPFTVPALQALTVNA